ncbi:hypothetical protein HMPREF3227_00024 [Corynebacterium sp. CMW7794]|uniref:hypothetical protein n=1 Tax=Corynebacterium TaxID=1716 RepID=UPI000794BA54|nr:MULTISPECIES: hypothetical protein [Corynebacterium]KXI19861.1 hypothetical protein HMPREF3227_00024 [Corynebacterium sp. CMW7794]OFL79567.1 hypothetical protein HMPREF2748_09780 [Corynebacterium sp. HMSC077B05]OFN42391.1 hypothetical protein HMPREF2559_11670 [Corynebacterium sp. HMSC072G08]OFP19879.1 hypothetical protein HMPREF2998_08875 [Corynebacterium sp. HMSC065A05]OFP65088.1 hypothetical protein HMPREF2976_03215 [Corynebacterium sp. HMSC077D10]
MNNTQAEQPSQQAREQAQPVIRTNFDRGEAVTGLVWLSLGAIFSLLLEVVYLGARLPLGETSIPFPVTIAVAFGFNLVLTRTALLWSRRTLVAAVPLIVWTLGFLALALAGGIGSLQALPATLSTILLFAAGVAGGGWPFFNGK